MNNIAWIISELIYRNEIIVDGKEITQKIISVETLSNLFSQLNIKVILLLSSTNYEVKDNLTLTNVGITLFAIISFYNPYPYGQGLNSLLPGYYFKQEDDALDKDPIINVISENIVVITRVLQNPPPVLISILLLEIN